jgi:hypothetical protein
MYILVSIYETTYVGLMKLLSLGKYIFYFQSTISLHKRLLLVWVVPGSVYSVFPYISHQQICVHTADTTNRLLIQNTVPVTQVTATELHAKSECHRAIHLEFRIKSPLPAGELWFIKVICKQYEEVESICIFAWVYFTSENTQRI